MEHHSGIRAIKGADRLGSISLLNAVLFCFSSGIRENGEGQRSKYFLFHIFMEGKIMGFKSDIEIAQECTMTPITEIAKKAGIEEKYLEQYGK